MIFNNMLVASLLFIVSITAISQTCATEELEIHNTFKPEICDRKAAITDVLTLHYKGSLKENGKVFDSSYERNDPFSFQLGIGQVIKGWDKGLVGVCVGEKVRLVIPPSLGYGDKDHDKIPAQSTLEFEIEILKIEEGPNPVNVFKEIDKNSDDKLSREEVSEFLQSQLGKAGEIGDHEAILEEVFKHEDKDGDSYITKDEFSGPKYDHDEL